MHSASGGILWDLIGGDVITWPGQTPGLPVVSGHRFYFTGSSSRDGQGRDSWSLQQQVVVMCLPRLWLYSTLYYNELPLQSTAAGRLSQYHIIYNGKHKKSVREFLPDTILTTIAQLVQLFERCLVQVVRRNNHYSPSPGHHIQNDMFVECNFIHILTGCFHQM